MYFPSKKTVFASPVDALIWWGNTLNMTTLRVSFWRRRAATVPAWVILAGTLCVTLVAGLPFTSVIYWFGDEGLALGAAQRMLDGMVLYKDFFELVPPSSFVVTALWISIFGETIFAARMLVIVCVLITCGFVYAASFRATGARWIPAILVFGWAAMSYGFSTYLNHHWFSTACISVAIWASLPPRPQQGVAFIGGLAVGLAATMTTSRGGLAAAALLAVYFVLSNRRQFMLAVLGLVIFPALTLAYVIAKDASAEAFRSLFVFTSQNYAGIQGTSFGYAASGQNYPLVAFIPGTLLLAAVAVIAKPKHRLSDPKFIAASVWAMVALISCFPRPDIYHIIPNVPGAIPLFMISVSAAVKSAAARHAILVVAMLASLPTAKAYARAVRDIYRADAIATPAGSLVIPLTGGEKDVIRLISTLPAADRILFYPYIPLMPYVVGRPQVGPIDEFLPYYTTPEQYRSSCRAALKTANWFILERSWTQPDTLRDVFPHMRHFDRPEKVDFEDAIRANSKRVALYGEYEIRKKTVPTRSCERAPTH